GGRELLEREPRHLDDDVVEGRLERRARVAGEFVGHVFERVADGHLRGDLGDREPGRLGGQRARPRHARVHLDDDDPAVLGVDGELDVAARAAAGLRPNGLLRPPVSTPTSRMMAMPMSRSRWYSRSVSVSAGATVIESPVCTPIGSKFSIEHTTTTLSAWSRMTSSSYSFQPRIDSSRSTSVVGLSDRPRPAMRSRSSSSCAIPERVPPMVNDGRTTTG